MVSVYQENVYSTHSLPDTNWYSDKWRPETALALTYRQNPNLSHTPAPSPPHIHKHTLHIRQDYILCIQAQYRRKIGKLAVTAQDVSTEDLEMLMQVKNGVIEG